MQKQASLILVFHRRTVIRYGFQQSTIKYLLYEQVTREKYQSYK